MNAGDPRHGTTAGYRAGCHDPCCREVIRRDTIAARLEAMRGRPREMPARGMVRRLQALNAIGWTWKQLGDALGVSYQAAHHRASLNPDTYCHRTTHEAVRGVYDRLSMTPPPQGHYHDRTRKAAAKKGWAVPLAWDDIDDPAARPAGLRRAEGGRARIHLADVLELTYQGLTYEQVAARLGCSRDGVYDKLRRAGKVDALRILRIRGEETSAGRAVKGVKGRTRRVA